MGADASAKSALADLLHAAGGADQLVAQPAPAGPAGGPVLRRRPAAGCVPEKQELPRSTGTAWNTVPPVGEPMRTLHPYVDPVFQNNVILTKTESLTMNSRPKDPKTARNKNVLVIGGSGSGKTRFWLKAEPDADAQFLCGHRPEGNHFGGVRKNAPAGRTQAGERRKAHEGQARKGNL